MRYYQVAMVFSKFTVLTVVAGEENYRIRPIKTSQLTVLPETNLDHDQMAKY